MLILLLTLAVLIVSILAVDCKREGVQAAAIVMIILTAIALIILFFAVPIVYFGSLDVYGKLIAAQKLVPQYERAITETKGAVVELSNGAGLVDVSEGLANLKHSSQTAERIYDMRKYLKWYYETLERYRMYNSKWFCRRFIAKMPGVLLEGE